MRWLAGRWFGRGCFECEQCGEFPDLGSPIVSHHDAPRTAPAARIPVKRDERPRVLLVDDSIEQCDLYALMLEPTASVITASRGEEALSIARAEPLDAIVLDVMMPGMDGWEVCRRLKDSPVTSHIPVLLLTSLDGVEAAGPGHRAGAAAVLMKPCPAERLAIAIEAAVRKPADLEAVPDFVSDITARPPRRWRRRAVAKTIPSYVDESPARILDVSYGGVRVEIADTSLDVPPSFDISFPDAHLAVHLDLVWKSRAAAGGWLCGARVTHPDAMAADAWRGLVDSIADCGMRIAD